MHSLPDTLFQSRVEALRTEIKRLGLDGFIVPMADEYQSEYAPPEARRIEYLIGFTGSAGIAVITADKAAFFTDGRYTLQAGRQIPPKLCGIYDIGVKAPLDWIKENLRAKSKLGFDSKLHTEEQADRYEKSLKGNSIELIPCDRNPVDIVWQDKPIEKKTKIYAHDLIYSGVSSAEKRRIIAEKLKSLNVNAAIICDPESVAWLLNIRGGDVPNAPIPLSRAIIRSNAFVEWFVDGDKIPSALYEHLGSEITCLPPSGINQAIRRLTETKSKVFVDKNEISRFLTDELRRFDCKIEFGENPCLLPKAWKNQTEIEGMRSAHRRDGAALVKFLAWLDKNAPDGNITEIRAVAKLEEFRGDNDMYKGPSFDTIAAAGPNAAIVHYKSTEETDRTLEINSLFLLDSGGQYPDGTTDVTRTVVIGNPTSEMRDRFTRVLKGHIALANVRFPEGVNGSHLDVLARQYLWAAGLDYEHGTGHGVGSFSGVHEGPQGISRKNHVALKPGMVLSNEPGYYKPNAYGIRTENLMLVVEIPETAGYEKKMLGFETLTMAPIDTRCVVADMLTVPEREWLNAYHARIRTALGPMLDAETRVWLEEKTEPL